MIKPTIGRIVWYHPPASRAGSQPWPAIVTFVHTDEYIDVTAFPPCRAPEPLDGVTLWQEDGPDPRPFDSYAEWMPYQLGQAAKTAEFEKQL